MHSQFDSESDGDLLSAEASIFLRSARLVKYHVPAMPGKIKLIFPPAQPRVIKS